jgi:hypothetical protein
MDFNDRINDPGFVAVVSPSGQVGTIPKNNLDLAQKQGFRAATQDEVKKRLEGEKYSGFGAGTKAFGAGLLSGLTFGASNKILYRGTGVKKETLQKLRAYQPGATTAGEIVGAIAPMFIPGGQAGVASRAGTVAKVAKGVGTAPRLVSRLGATTEKTLAGLLLREGTQAGRIAKGAVSIGSKMAGAGVEGGIYGLGQAITERDLGDEEYNAEKMLSTVAKGALFGAAGAGVLSATGKIAKTVGTPVLKQLKGSTPMQKITGWLKDFSEKRAVKALGRDTGAYKRLTRKGNRPERINELGEWLLNYKVATEKGEQSIITKLDDLESISSKLDTAQDVAGSSIGDALKDLDELPDISQIGDKAGNIYMTSEGKLTAFNPIDIANRIENEVIIPRAKVLGTAKNSLVKEAETIAAQLRAREQAGITLLDTNNMRIDLDKQINWDRISTRDGSLTGKGEVLQEIRSILSDEIDRKAKVISEIKDAGQTYNNWLKAKKDYSNTMSAQEFVKSELQRRERNRFISPSDYGSGLGLGIASAVTSGSIPTGLLWGGFSAATNKMMRERGPQFLAGISDDIVKGLSSIQKSTSVIDKRIDKAVKTFFDTETVRVAAPLSTKILFDSKWGRPAKKENLIDSYKRNSKEITRLVENINATSDGLINTTKRMSNIAPKITENMNTKAINLLQLLYDKMPKKLNRPGYSGRPSDAEIIKWSKYLDAIDDPLSVIEGLSHGRISREGVEVLRVGYPKLYEEVKLKMLNSMADREVPYNKRVLLSILFNTPFEHFMEPNVLATIQGSFEPTQETQAQTGNIRKSEPMLYKQLAMT